MNMALSSFDCHHWTVVLGWLMYKLVYQEATQLKFSSDL